MQSCLKALIGCGLAANAMAAPVSISGTFNGAEVASKPRAQIGGEHVVIDMRAPTKDTSTYANIGSGGNTREYAWLSYYPGEGRQSSMLTMFDTASAGAVAGDAARRIRINSVTATAVTFPSGPRASYDPTPDPWQSTLWAGGDLEVFESLGGTNVIGSVFVPADPRYIELDPIEQGNRPVELFAVRFNNGLSAEAWNESSGGTPGYSGSAYNAEPIDFDASGSPRSVFNSFGETAIEFVTGPFVGDDGNTYDTYHPTGNLLPNPADGFDPNPLALGRSYTIPNGTPGHSIFGQGQTPIELGDQIPPAHRLRFDLRVKDPAVQQYLRDSMAEGWVSLMYSQLAFGIIGGEREYSYWLTKEGASSLPGTVDLDPCTLRIDYIVLDPGDINGNGIRDRQDIFWQIRYLSDPETVKASFPLLDVAALADTNEDGKVDITDVIDLANLVTTTPESSVNPRIGPTTR